MDVQYLQKTTKRFVVGRWSKQGCINSAREYSDLKTWMRERKTSYLAARDNGWLETCCTHMKQKQRVKWTFEKCIQSSSKYHSRMEWANGDGKAYRAAIKNNWLEECCKHMVPKRKGGRNSKWTLEKCVASARECASRKEWQKKSPAAYSAARRNGWLVECYGHMMRCDVKWNEQICVESASGFATRSLWYKNEPGAYLAAKKLGIFDACCSHMFDTSDLVTKHTLLSCKQSAQSFNSLKAWRDEDYNTYKAALRKGWLEKCCVHMEQKHAWTIELCKEIASNYISPNEWRKSEPSSYSSAHRNGWFEECCEYMEKQQSMISNEFCLDIATSFNSISDFKNYEFTIYKIAKKRGLLPSIREIIETRKIKAWFLKRFGDHYVER